MVTSWQLFCVVFLLSCALSVSFLKGIPSDTSSVQRVRLHRTTNTPALRRPVLSIIRSEADDKESPVTTDGQTPSPVDPYADLKNSHDPEVMRMEAERERLLKMAAALREQVQVDSDQLTQQMAQRREQSDRETAEVIRQLQETSASRLPGVVKKLLEDGKLTEETLLRIDVMQRESPSTEKPEWVFLEDSIIRAVQSVDPEKARKFTRAIGTKRMEEGLPDLISDSSSTGGEAIEEPLAEDLRALLMPWTRDPEAKNDTNEDGGFSLRDFVTGIIPFWLPQQIKFRVERRRPEGANNQTFGSLFRPPVGADGRLFGLDLDSVKKFSKDDINFLRSKVVECGFDTDMTRESAFALCFRGSPDSDKEIDYAELKKKFAELRKAVEENERTRDVGLYLFREGDLTPDPTKGPQEVIAEGMSPFRPCVLALLKPAFGENAATWWNNPFVKVIANIFTIFFWGKGLFDGALLTNPENFITALGPPVVGVIAIGVAVLIAAVRYLTHTAVASSKGAKLTTPLGIGWDVLGFLGFHFEPDSVIESWDEMFDICVSGILAGFVLSAVGMVVGMGQTVGADIDVAGGWPLVPASFFHNNLPLGILTTLFDPSLISQPQNVMVPISPLLFGSWWGFLGTALAGLPFSASPGGRMASASLGGSLPGLVGQLPAIVFFISGFLNEDPVALYYSAIAAFLIGFEKPFLKDNISPVGPVRQSIFFLTALVSILTCLPFDMFVSLQTSDPQQLQMMKALGGGV